MKKARSLTALLLALALTGCGAKTETSVPVPATETATEAVTETETITKTEAVTETAPATEAETKTAIEVGTEAPAEETTEPIGQLSPVTDAEQTAYRYLKEKVIPTIGLSDLAGFPMVDWNLNNGTGVQPPASAQGLISAVVHDFEADGSPELVTVWSQGFSYYVDVYQIGGGTCTLLNSFKCCEYSESASCSPEVMIQGNKVLAKNYWMALPGMSRYGSELSVYAVQDGGVSQTLSIGSARYPGTEILTVNGEDYMTTEGEMDYAHADELIEQALRDAGVQYDDFSNGWGTEGMDLLYGLNLIISDCMPVMSVEYTNDDLDMYIDDTSLRERLSSY